MRPKSVAPTTNTLRMTRHPSSIRSVSSPRSGRLPDPDGYRTSRSVLSYAKGDTMMCSIAATLSILALEACVHEQVAIPFQTIGGPAR